MPVTQETMQEIIAELQHARAAYRCVDPGGFEPLAVAARKMHDASGRMQVVVECKLEAAKPQVDADLIEQLQKVRDNLICYPTDYDTIEQVLAAVEAAPCEEPAPDFTAMDADEMRAWLDERGRRCLWEMSDGWQAELNSRIPGKRIAVVYEQPTEPAALLALCENVAAQEAS